jgi:hypothetical protein
MLGQELPKAVGVRRPVRDDDVSSASGRQQRVMRLLEGQDERVIALPRLGYPAPPVSLGPAPLHLAHPVVVEDKEAGVPPREAPEAGDGFEEHEEQTQKGEEPAKLIAKRVGERGSLGTSSATVRSTIAGRSAMNEKTPRTRGLWRTRR